VTGGMVYTAEEIPSKKSRWISHKAGIFEFILALNTIVFMVLKIFNANFS